MTTYTEYLYKHQASTPLDSLAANKTRASSSRKSKSNLLLVPALVLAGSTVGGAPGCAAAPAFRKGQSYPHKTISMKHPARTHAPVSRDLRLCPRACVDDDDEDCNEDDSDDSDDGDDNSDYEDYEDRDVHISARSSFVGSTGMLNQIAQNGPLQAAMDPAVPPAPAASPNDVPDARSSSAAETATAESSRSQLATSSAFATSLPSASYTTLVSAPPTVPNARPSTTIFSVPFSTSVTTPSPASVRIPIFSPSALDSEDARFRGAEQKSDSHVHSSKTAVAFFEIASSDILTSQESSHARSSTVRVTTHHTTTSYTMPTHKLTQGPGLAVRPSNGVDLSGGLNPVSQSSTLHRRTFTIISLVGAIVTISAVALLMIHFVLKARKMKAAKLASKDSIKGFGTVEWIDPTKGKDSWHPVLGDITPKEKSTEKSASAAKRDSLVSHWLRLNPRSSKSPPRSGGRLSLLPRIHALLGRTPSSSSNTRPSAVAKAKSKDKVIDIRPYNLGSRFSVSSSDIGIDESYGSLGSLRSLEVIDLDADHPAPGSTRVPPPISTPTSPNLIDSPLVTPSVEKQTLLRASSTSVATSKSITPGHLRTRSAPHAPDAQIASSTIQRSLTVDRNRNRVSKHRPQSHKHKSQTRSMSALTISSKYTSGAFGDGEYEYGVDAAESDWDIAEAYARRSERYSRQPNKGVERGASSKSRSSTKRPMQTHVGEGDMGRKGERNSEYTMYRRSDWI